jgi:hypothetical protein
MNQSVERLAAELVALPLSGLSAVEANELIVGVLGDADLDIRQAALDLAAELMRKRSAETARKANVLLALSRLANATGCPPGTPIGPWLEGLGLIEPDGVGGYVPTPQASTRLV